MSVNQIGSHCHSNRLSFFVLRCLGYFVEADWSVQVSKNLGYQVASVSKVLVVTMATLSGWKAVEEAGGDVTSRMELDTCVKLLGTFILVLFWACVHPYSIKPFCWTRMCSLSVGAHRLGTVPEQSIKPDHLSPSRKVREGLADVISIHELLTNQILLFNFETVATPWLQDVRLVLF